MQKTRDISLDSVAGLLIIVMILGHVIQRLGLDGGRLSYYLQLFFPYFMVWFFFKAGMLFKSKPMKQVVIDKFNRLIIPFILWSLIGYPVQVARDIIEIYTGGGKKIIEICLLNPLKSLLAQGSMSSNLPLWFLPSLFITIIVSNRLICLHKKKYLYTILILILLFIIQLTPIRLPLYIGNILLGIFFFMIGNSLKELQYHKLVFLISGIVSLLILVLLPSFVDFRANKLIFGNYYIWLFASIFNCIFINNIFKRISFLNRLKLNIIGKDSMNYYISHWIVIGLTVIIFKDIMNIKNLYVLFAVTIMSLICLLPPINRLLKSNIYLSFIKKKYL